MRALCMRSDGCTYGRRVRSAHTLRLGLVHAAGGPQMPAILDDGSSGYRIWDRGNAMGMVGDQRHGARGGAELASCLSIMLWAGRVKTPAVAARPCRPPALPAVAGRGRWLDPGVPGRHPRRPAAGQQPAAGSDRPAARSRPRLAAGGSRQAATCHLLWVVQSSWRPPATAVVGSCRQTSCRLLADLPAVHANLGRATQWQHASLTAA